MRFFAELQRRNVIRMAGLYLVGAWLIVQVAGTVLPMFGSPDWIARSILDRPGLKELVEIRKRNGMFKLP